MGVNLLIFQVAICIGYFIYVLFLSTPFASYFLPSILIVTMMSVFLWIRKRYQSAIIFDLVGLNIMLFFLSERLSVFTGVDLFYVAIATASLALFGYEYWRAGISFALFSLVLFLTSRFFSFDAIELRVFTQRQEEIFFAINSIAVSIVSVYSVVTVMKMNYEAQKKLHRTKDTIEKQNFELAKINEELDRFVYSASHDLRSPLSSMKGLVNVFEMDPDALKEEYLPKIKSRIQTMEKLLITRAMQGCR